MKLGVFGGTFDPYHLGHEHVCLHTMQALKLNRIILVPNKHPVDGKNPQGAAAHRSEILKLSTSHLANVQIDLIEQRRSTKSYSFDTLVELLDIHDLKPEQLFMIVGADSVLGMPNWYKAEKFSSLCQLAVFPRNGITSSEVFDITHSLGWSSNQTANDLCCHWVDMPEFPLSSSLIRKRLASASNTTKVADDKMLSQPLDFALSQALNPRAIAYISQHQIYS